MFILETFAESLSKGLSWVLRVKCFKGRSTTMPGMIVLLEQTPHTVVNRFWMTKLNVERLHVYEVPGNHDSMVLEPNVRVLVSLIRRAIKSAESSFEAPREDVRRSA